MDSVAAVSNSIDAVNQVLVTANQQSLAAAEKMMKVSVEMNVGQEMGKGQLMDVTG